MRAGQHVQIQLGPGDFELCRAVIDRGQELAHFHMIADLHQDLRDLAARAEGDVRSPDGDERARTGGRDDDAASADVRRLEIGLRSCLSLLSPDVVRVAATGDDHDSHNDENSAPTSSEHRDRNPFHVESKTRLNCTRAT